LSHYLHKAYIYIGLRRDGGKINEKFNEDFGKITVGKLESQACGE
jgi:hypothetical protein